MRITEIASQSASGGWEKLDPYRLPSILLAQIPQYYRGSHNIWALNPTKFETPLMAIGDFGIWEPIINDKYFSKEFVAAMLTNLVNFTGKQQFSTRSGYVWRDPEVLPFFDAFSFPKIAPADGANFWYEVPLAQEIFGYKYQNQRSVADKCYAILPNKAFNSADDFHTQLFNTYRVFTKGTKVISISGNVGRSSLQNLVDAVGLTDSSRAHGSTWIVRNGKVEDLYQVAFTDPDGTLSDGTKLWKLPSYVIPALGTIQFEKTWKTADSAFLALLPKSTGTELNNTILVAIRKGNILGMARGNNAQATEPELAHLASLLANEKGVGASKDKFIKPNSNFHNMLKYVDANPGSPRTGYFVKGLGRSAQGLPAVYSPQSLDGLAARLELLTLKDPGDKPTTYHLRLTSEGELMLDWLDAGRKINLTDIARKVSSS
jgi:hypothetical protein